MKILFIQPNSTQLCSAKPYRAVDPINSIYPTSIKFIFCAVSHYKQQILFHAVYIAALLQAVI